MNISIQKAENGWIVIREFQERAFREYHVFKDLQSLGEWIVSECGKQKTETQQ